jgi:hypothetical protein
MLQAACRAAFAVTKKAGAADLVAAPAYET